MTPARPLRVASVTPLPIVADSRTFKEASSIARFGYESIVVQGTSGPLPPGSVDFTLINAGPKQAAPTPTPQRQTSSTTASSPREERLPPRPPSSDDSPYPPGSLRDRVLRASRRLPRPLFLTARVVANVLIAVLEGSVRLILVLASQRPPSEAFNFTAGLKHIVSSNRRAEAALPPADLYYLHSPEQYWAVRKLCRRHGARFIYDAHDFYSVQSHDGRDRTISNRMLWWIYDEMERRCVRDATACVTVSDGVADLCRSRFNCDFAVVRNAHDRRLDVADAVPLRTLIGLEDRAFLMVVVGNAKAGGMATQEAIEALRVLPEDVHLAFLGRGYEEHLDDARRAGVADRFHAPGPVPPSQVAATIAGADVSPILYWEANSNFEFALPNRFYHPLAAGLPILYPPLTEMRRLAERYRLGLPIDPTAPSTLVDAVHALRREPGLLAEFRANVRAAADELSWEAEERMLQRVVAGALDGKR